MHIVLGLTKIGNALPDILADIQDVCNATLRALINNQAMASGPQVVVDEERLSVLERAATDHVALTAGMIRDVSVRWLQGQETDPANVATLVNAFNRTAAILGWQRRAKDISAPALRDYVATTYAAGGGK